MICALVGATDFTFSSALNPRSGGGGGAGGPADVGGGGAAGMNAAGSAFFESSVTTDTKNERLSATQIVIYM